MRTWHDVVAEILTDPLTGKFRRGLPKTVLDATGVPPTTFYKNLKKRTSPRKEIEYVTRLAKALSVDPARLLMPETHDTPSRRLVSAAEFSAALLPPDRQRLLRALSDPDDVAWLIVCLDARDRTRAAVPPNGRHQVSAQRRK